MQTCVFTGIAFNSLLADAESAEIDSYNNISSVE